MKKQDDGKFKTHIAEPRWQQIVSVLIILGLIALWIWGLSRH